MDRDIELLRKKTVSKLEKLSDVILPPTASSDSVLSQHSVFSQIGIGFHVLPAFIAVCVRVIISDFYPYSISDIAANLCQKQKPSSIIFTSTGKKRDSYEHWK